MRAILIFLAILFSVETFAEEEFISFRSNGDPLFGTFSYPDKEGPFPLVFMIHGAGSIDRDHSIPLTEDYIDCIFPELYNQLVTPFKDIEEQLVKNGIAVYRFDKRTHLYDNSPELRPGTFIKDAVNGLKRLKEEAIIDDENLFVLGFEQGGNFTPHVAQEVENVEGIINLATPARPIDTVAAEQLRWFQFLCENPEEGDKLAESFYSKMQQIRKKEAKEDEIFDGHYVPFWEKWIALTDTTMEDFEHSDISGLFLSGQTDYHIPLEDNFEQFRANLSPEQYDFFSLEGLNHFFTPFDQPKAAEQVGDTISAWIDEQGGLAASIRKKDPPKEVKINFESDKISIQALAPIHKTELLTATGKSIDEHFPQKETFEIKKSKLRAGVPYLLRIFTSEKAYSTRFLITS